MRWLAVLAFLLTACLQEAGVATTSVPIAEPAPTSRPTTTSTPAEPNVTEYLPGLDARLHLLAGSGRAPLVVMVPGGAWMTADPAGLEGLANHLAESGIMAVTVEVRAAQDDVVYPTPVEDVLCAVAYAASAARSNGFEANPLVLLGHSSGAHLAALAVLGAVSHSAGCPYPEATPEALIGLAGVYDVSVLPDLALPLFGASQEEKPDLWASGNPLLRADLRPEVPVLLIHGESDELVPLSFSIDFAEALEGAGHPTTVETVPEAGHDEVYSPEWVGERLVDWVTTLSS